MILTDSFSFLVGSTVALQHEDGGPLTPEVILHHQSDENRQVNNVQHETHIQ